MMGLPVSPEPQPCLFGGLPSTEPRRRRSRAAAATEPTGPVTAEPVAPAPLPLPLRPPPVTLRIDAAALTRPELCDLVRDLGEANLGVLLVEAAREALEVVQPGRAVILAPPGHLGTLAQALKANELPFADPERGVGGLEDSLVLLRSDEANGLEFDAAIVVEAAEIARGGRPTPTPRGLRTLYVAMTRPTKVLRIVSSEPFPVEIVS